MRELLDIGRIWGKLSEIKKIRVVLMVLIETEPAVKVACIVLHVLSFLGLTILAALHLWLIVAVYVCAQIAVGLAYHWDFR